MHYFYQYLFLALWIIWALYWWISAGDVKQTVWREPLISRLLHILPLAIASILLWVPELPVLGLNWRLIPATAPLFWVCAALTASGLLICVWARRVLGRNWSGTVTLKADHELITGGPYAYVRHPIYTGLLLAFFGSALARGDGRGLLALLLVTLALWRKLRIEERGMRSQFGSAYSDYAERVAALIPFLL